MIKMSLSEQLKTLALIPAVGLAVGAANAGEIDSEEPQLMPDTTATEVQEYQPNPEVLADLQYIRGAVTALAQTEFGNLGKYTVNDVLEFPFSRFADGPIILEVGENYTAIHINDGEESELSYDLYSDGRADVFVTSPGFLTSAELADITSSALSNMHEFDWETRSAKRNLEGDTPFNNRNVYVFNHTKGGFTGYLYGDLNDEGELDPIRRTIENADSYDANQRIMKTKIDATKGHLEALLKPYMPEDPEA